jgi:hypothetical protein
MENGMVWCKGEQVRGYDIGKKVEEFIKGSLVEVY